MLVVPREGQHRRVDTTVIDLLDAAIHLLARTKTNEIICPVRSYITK